MDLSQAAFGLDMRAASRIYFINPVLNPQVQAQAIGRVRRISQQKPVSVETLVLKGSLDEIILERKQQMTQAEHRRIKSILDVRPIYDWIKNARITLADWANTGVATEMIPLRKPLMVFGKGFGQPVNPNEGIILEEGTPTRKEGPSVRFSEAPSTPNRTVLAKRPFQQGQGAIPVTKRVHIAVQEDEQEIEPARRVRFA